MTKANSRQSEYPVDPLFLERWSPRAFTGEAMPPDDLLTILDAAHWAPSASNFQPWRFIYAHNGSEQWQTLFDLLMDGNKRWVDKASVLLFVVSRTYNVSREGEKKPSATHSFDAGAAWFSMAMQSQLLGYHAHGMGGIYRDKALEALDIPDGYQVEAAVAIGKIADKDTLPDDLREREVPSGRLPLADVAFEGKFTGKID